MATGRIPAVQNASTLAGATLATNVTASSLTSFGTSPTLTTPVISTYTTAGDLVVGTGSGGIARIAGGTSGYLLTSAGATSSPTWAAASVASAAQCTVYSSTALTYTGGTPLLQTYANEETDTNAFHDNSTNNDRITIPASYGGVYVVTFTSLLQGGTTYIFPEILKNGASLNGAAFSSSPFERTSVAIVITLVPGDYLTTTIQNGGSGSMTTQRRFSAVRIGA